MSVVVGLVVLAALSGLFLIAQSSWAKNKAVAAIAGLLSQEGGTQVRVDGVGGRGLAHVTVDHIRLADQTGTWLEISHAALHWHPLRLLTRTVSIADLSAAGITYLRAPASPESSQSTALSVPTLPVTVSVKHLNVGRIALPGVSNARVPDFALKASGLWARSGNMRLDVDAKSVGNEAASLSGHIALDTGRRDVDADVTYREAPGGLLAHIAGLKADRPAAAEIDLSGPIGALDGYIRLASGPDRPVDLTFQSTQMDSRFARLSGILTWPPGDAARAYRLDVSYGLSRHAELTLDGARIQFNGTDMLVRGQIDFEREKLALHYKVMADRDGGASGFSVASLQVEGDLSGPWKKMSLTGTGRAATLSGAGVSAAGVTAQLQASAQQAKKTGWTVQGQTNFEAASLAQKGKNPLRMENLRWQTNLNWTGRDNRVSIVSSRLVSDIGELTAQGTITALGSARQSLNLSLQGAVAKAPAARARGLFDTPLALRLVAHQDAGAPNIELRDLSAANTDMSLTAKGTIRSNFKSLDVTAQSAVEDLVSLGEALGQPLGGKRAQFSGHIWGALDDPSLEGTLESSRLIVRNRTLTKLRGDIKLKTPATAPDGSFNLSASTDRGPLTALVRVKPDTHGFLQSNLVLSAPDTDIKGDVLLTAHWMPVTGDISGKVGDLSQWSWLAGQRLAGSATVATHFREVSGLTQSDLAVEAHGLRADDIRANTLTLNSTGTLGSTPSQTFTLTADRIRRAEFQLASLQINGSTDFHTTDASFKSQGRYTKPFITEGGIRLSFDDAGFTATLNRWQVGVDNQIWVLNEPASLARSANGLSLSVVSISGTGDAYLEAQGEKRGDHLTVKGDLRKIPARLAALWDPAISLQGQISGNLALSAGGGADTGTADLTLTGIKAAAQPDGTALSGPLQMRWNGRDVTGEWTISQGSSGYLKARFGLPVSYRPNTGFRLDEAAAVSGKLDVNLAIAPIWDLFAFENHTLSGNLIADLTFSGTARAVQANGEARLVNGQYQQHALGIFLDRMSIDATVHNRRFELVKATATDGGSGTLRMTGYLVADPGRHSPRAFDIDVEHALLVQRSDVTARASGHLSYRRDDAGGRAEGKITTDEVDIQIPEHPSTDIVNLDVVEVGVNPAETKPSKSEPESRVKTQLAVDVAIPNRAFVRGRGLDSEWMGKLQLRGTLDAPRLLGDLSLLRGDLSFLGRQFNLSKGRIGFRGNKGIDPELDIVANYQAKGLDTSITVTGKASKPVIDLSSDPALPDNEILSQILFGRSTGSLSAFEAVQLADSARLLSGHGPAIGLLGLARQSLGLDVLKLSNEAGTGPSVTGGKYLNERVYVEVGSGGRSQGESVGVQVELTKSLSVKTDLSSASGTNAGITWEHDY